MVGQAGKGLDADDIGRAGGDELHHLSGQEPPLAVLVAQGQEGLRGLGDSLDGHGRLKPAALLQRVNGRLADRPDGLDAHLGQHIRGDPGPQELVAVFPAQQAVVEEIQHIRHHGLGPFSLQHLHQVVVGQWHILDQDLSHNAHPGLAEGLVNGEGIKGLHDPPADLGIGQLALGVRQRIDGDLLPLLVEGIGRAGGQLIGPDPVEAAHKQVAVDNGVDGIQNETWGELEALVFLHAVGIDGDHRDLGAPGLLQGPANEGHIVAGPAAAAGLGHDDGQVIQVVFPGEHRLHDLAHHGDGGEAGIVIDVFQPRVNGAAVVVVQHHHIVAVLLEDGL